VFCDRCRIKSDGGLGVKIAVVVQVKEKEEKKKEEEKKEEEEEARTAALGGIERLNKA
jgi:hypothetical protein